MTKSAAHNMKALKTVVLNAVKDDCFKTWLFIATTQSGEFRIGLLGQKVEVVSGQGKSHKILPALARRITPQKIKRLDGICVVSGPGSFTAVRTGVLVANLLARYFAKPLVGVSLDEAQDLEKLGRELAAHVHKPVRYVAPVYFAEPNIILKSKTGVQCYV